MGVLRSKGYCGWGWHVAIQFSPIIGWAIFTFFLYTPLPGDPDAIKLGYSLWMFIGLAVPAIVIAFLPRKPIGIRGVPSFYIRSRLAGEAVLIFLPMLLIVLVYTSPTIRNGRELRFFVAIFTIYFLEYARRSISANLVVTMTAP
jgi:hypothetical protein